MKHTGYFAVTFTDVTERKQSEEENRRLNQKLEQRVVGRTAQKARRRTWAKGTVNQGATFYVFLPQKQHGGSNRCVPGIDR